jgi:hypothetical protein
LDDEAAVEDSSWVFDFDLDFAFALDAEAVLSGTLGGGWEERSGGRSSTKLLKTVGTALEEEAFVL